MNLELKNAAELLSIRTYSRASDIVDSALDGYERGTLTEIEARQQMIITEQFNDKAAWLAEEEHRRGYVSDDELEADYSAWERGYCALASDVVMSELEDLQLLAIGR